MELTITDLRATIANLEALLKERDHSLGKAQSQMRGIAKLIENKTEKQVSISTVKTTEEIAEEQAKKEC